MSILKNSVSIIAGNFFNKIASVIVLFLIAGSLDSASFGRYSFAVSYLAFFAVFTDLGINTLITRDISSEAVYAPLAFGHAILIRLTLSFFALALALSGLLVLSYGRETVMIVIASAPMLFFSFKGLFFRTVFDIPFQSRLKMAVPSVVNALSEFLTLAAAAWLVHIKAPLLWLVLGISLSYMPGFALAAFLSTRLIKPEFRFDAARLKALILRALPLAGAVFFEGLFLITPVFVLSRLSTEAAIGLYSLPQRLVTSLWVVPVALMVTLLPGMSRGMVQARAGLLKAVRALLIAGLPITLLTAAYSSELMFFFAGHEYAGSSAVLSIMIWGTLAYFINTAFFYGFVAAGLQSANMLIWAVISALSVAASLALIPEYHEAGAALGFALPLISVIPLNIILAKRLLGISVWTVMAHFALSGAGAALVFFVMPAAKGLSVAVSVAVYAAMLFILRAIAFTDEPSWFSPLYRNLLKFLQKHLTDAGK
ncbi:MAG: oligosaccharide flippase family protein [Deltaproteobacteria bacterium]